MADMEPCPLDARGLMTYVEDDYDWYGKGDYEVYDCTVHGRHYFQLPD